MIFKIDKFEIVFLNIKEGSVMKLIYAINGIANTGKTKTTNTKINILLNEFVK